MSFLFLKKGNKGLAENSSLIRHTSTRQTQEDIMRQQSAERSTNNTENQAFLNEVCYSHTLSLLRIGFATSVIQPLSAFQHIMRIKEIFHHIR